MRRTLKRDPIPHLVWQDVTRRIAVLQELDAVQMAHLRELTTWFLHSKAINGVQGLEVTLAMRVAVAAQACLLILNLDIDCYDDWVEVVLYPGAFRVNHERRDAIGLVHNEANVLSGEAWLRGPVILSWDDVERDTYHPQPGHNVVLHEFAHKLDGLNGVTNGMPPLRRGMNRKSWAGDFSAGLRCAVHASGCRRNSIYQSLCGHQPGGIFRGGVRVFFYRAGDIEKLLPRCLQANGAVLPAVLSALIHHDRDSFSNPDPDQK